MSDERRLTSHASRLTAPLLSCAALGLVFWGLHQLDMPMIRFMRSVHEPWIEAGGDLLGRLGSGAALVAFSVVLLVAGRIRMKPALFHAGLQGLVAHGLAALATQLIKHTIGRPRPRVTHEGEFQFEPSLASGFDSFPSGHASASFAVATVLARHFPRLGWVSYLVAALIACSRVWRGSHFPTDILMGTMVGVLSGALVAYSYMGWPTIFSRTFARLALASTAVFMLFWPTVQSAQGRPSETLLLGIGVMAILLGLGWRWQLVRKGEAERACLWPLVLCWVGLALTTGLWLVSVAALLAGLAWLVSRRQAPAPFESAEGAARTSHGPWIDIALVASFVLAFAALQLLHGLLPIL